MLRGSAFTFRSYDIQRDDVQNRWGLIFSVASLLTPVVLGICIGTVVAGNIPLYESAQAAVNASPTFVARYVMPWCTPFALSIGLLTLSLFALLAAAYLTVETNDVRLQDDFRVRALIASVAVAVTAATSALFAERDAPLVFEALTRGMRAILLLSATTVFALSGVFALWKRAYKIARVAVAAQSVFIVWGWAWAQYPYMLPPNRTIDELAAPRSTLMWVMGTLVVGTLILLPSFFYLFRIFKSAGQKFSAEQDAHH